MDAIAYAELYARNVAETVEFFVEAFDFQAVAKATTADERSVLLRAGDIQLVITGSTAPRSKADYWIARHGDGVADIAVYCEDVSATLDRAMHAGLPVLQPARRGDTVRMTGMLGGIGALRHTLIDPAGHAVPVMPPGRPWVRIARDGQGGPSRLRLIDHVALCLPTGSLERLADLYTQVFGLIEHSREQIRVGESGMDSRVLRSPSGAITYVIAQPSPDSRDGQIEQFLRHNAGAGVQHLAFATAEIVSDVRAFSERGVGFCSTPDAYYDELTDRLPGRRPVQDQLAALRETGVLVASDHGGLLWQIFTTSPHRGRMPGQDGSLFHELIQRDGATGFAADNVIALVRAREAAAANSRLAG